MTKKKLFQISVAVMIAVVILGLMASFLTPVNRSGTNTCKESTPECTPKNSRDIKSEADFEPLTGKFFSALSY